MHLNPIIHTSVRLSSYGINLASQTAIRYPPYGSLSYSHIFYSFNHLALQWVGGSSLTSTLFHLTNLPADVLTRLYLDPIPKRCQFPHIHPAHCALTGKPYAIILMHTTAWAYTNACTHKTHTHIHTLGTLIYIHSHTRGMFVNLCQHG